MMRLAAKLAFVHRTLWHREQTYRWAVLLGPPPLLGCVVAAIAWAMAQHFTTLVPSPTLGSNAPWAHWDRPAAEDNQPFTEAPTAAVPQVAANAHTVAAQPGWTAQIQPISVDATLDVTVIGSSLGRFTLDQPTIPFARILDAGPPAGLFVGTGKTLFVVPTAGLYAFSARIARTGMQSADCLLRLGSAHHRILWNLVLNTAGDAVLNFPPTEFRLKPGLFLLQVAVGCWRGDHVVGSGEMSIMVRHPREFVLTPVTADELTRPVQ